jgi:hypothetical protein
MYIFMYVCMYVIVTHASLMKGMYVCMYVCMYVYLDADSALLACMHVKAFFELFTCV